MHSQTLYTIGHGSRSSQDFLSLLRVHGIDCLVDIRAYPRSRRQPQFSRIALEGLLSARGVCYAWEGEALGGMRRPRRDSPHIGLADAAFRGYADHMGTAEFAEAIARLADLGARRRTAFMCAEGLPQHCHRSFVADALLARGARVLHLVGEGDTRAHTLNAAARPASPGVLVYDAGEQFTFAF